jgi:MYXO-CTERM domain-containing protein
MLRRSSAALAVVSVLALGASARASLIGLELLEAPDVFSGFIDVTYDAGSNAFEASGFALSYLDVVTNPAQNIGDGLFTLTASIDEQGDALGGSLSIEGNVAGLGSSLLTGSLVDFGFSDAGGQILEFLFEVSGGDLSDAYGGQGALFGVIMDTGGAGYSGDWTQSFNNLLGGLPGTGSGVADTSPIPAPSALALVAIAGACGRRRRR